MQNCKNDSPSEPPPIESIQLKQIRKLRKEEEEWWLNMFTGADDGNEVRQTVAAERSDDGRKGSRVGDFASQSCFSHEKRTKELKDKSKINK